MAKGDAPVWHPDVQFFKVLDGPTGEHLASFYLDPYARPEDKRGGAWMGTCVGSSKVLDRKPVAYLTCNGSPPVDGKPSGGFVFTLNLKTKQSANKWILAGVANIMDVES